MVIHKWHCTNLALMVTCCVPKCKSDSRGGKGKGISFHEFPLNRELYNIWVLNIPREDWQPYESSKVCSLYFEEECYVKGFSIKRLVEGSVPTIFPNYPPSVSQAAKDRKPVSFCTRGQQETTKRFKSNENISENASTAEYSEVILEIETTDLPEHQETTKTIKSVDINENTSTAEFTEVILEIETTDLHEPQEATKILKLHKDIYSNAIVPKFRPDDFKMMPVTSAAEATDRKMKPEKTGYDFRTCNLLDQQDTTKKLKLDKDIYANAIVPDFRPDVFEMMPVAEAAEAMDELHKKIKAENTRYKRLKKQYELQQEKFSIFEAKAGKDMLRYSKILKNVIKDAEDGKLQARTLLKQLGAYTKNKKCKS